MMAKNNHWHTKEHSNPQPIVEDHDKDFDFDDTNWEWMNPKDP